MAQFFLTAIRISAEGNGGPRPIPKVVSLDTTNVVKSIPVLTGPSDSVQQTVVKTSRFRFPKTYTVAENIGEVVMMQDFNNAASSPYNTGTKANIAAAGTAQGTATAASTYYNSVTASLASPSVAGVQLPFASGAGNLGRAIVVKNGTVNNIRVWPQSNEILDSTSNASATVLAGQFKHFYCSATNKWVTCKGPYA